MLNKMKEFFGVPQSMTSEELLNELQEAPFFIEHAKNTIKLYRKIGRLEEAKRLEERMDYVSERLSSALQDMQEKIKNYTLMKDNIEKLLLNLQQK